MSDLQQEDVCVVVDSLAAAHKAADEFGNARIVTDNPLLAHDPKTNGTVEDITPLLPQDEAKVLGEAAVDILMELDDILFANNAAERYGGRSGSLNITNCMRGLLVGLLHRGTMMLRTVDRQALGLTHLLILDAPRWDRMNPWNLPRYACPYRPLAEAGFFGNRETRVQLIPAEVPTDPNDTSMDDVVLRALMVPPAMLLFELCKKLGIGRSLGRSGIAVGKLSEALRETLPWLAFRLYKFGSFELPSYAGPAPTPFGSPPHIDPWADAIVRPHLMADRALQKHFTAEQSDAIASVFLAHLSAGLASIAGTVDRLEQSIEDTFAGVSRRKILISSAYAGPIATQLYSLCLERGVTFVDFEHGATTGVALTSERRLRFSEATKCDALMVASKRAARSFSKSKQNGRPRIYEIGLAGQTRKVNWLPVQRRRSRARLRLKHDESVVIHVSSMIFGGNLRPGDDSPVESFAYGVEKTLLTNTYADLGKTVLYKPYPTTRHPHFCGYEEIFDLAPNIRVLDRSDFRYVRSAADIIVTGGNSSTLGWCVGTDVPMVYLNSRIAQSLVDDELRHQFAKAFFVIDLDSDDWSDRLKELLASDIEELRRGWADKKTARNTVLKDVMFGEKGSVGRRAARLIAREYV